MLADPALTVLPESQLFGTRARQERRRRKITADPNAILRDLQTLTAGAPVVAGRDEAPTAFPDAPVVAVRIPHDYNALLAGDMTVARAWRAAARAAFLHYLPRGYRVTAFVPGHGRDATYLLSR